MTTSNEVAPDPRPLVTTAFVRLVIGHFLQALGYSSMLLFPMYLDHLGANRGKIGAIMAASAVGGLTFRPIVAWSLDRIGRRVTLWAGTLTVVVSMAMVGFVTTPGPAAYVCRFLFGAGSGALLTAYFTCAADMVPIERRTEGIALFGISGLAPLVINPFSGALGIDAPALRWYFPALAVVVAASLLAVRRLPEPPRAPESKVASYSLRTVMAELTARSLLPTWLATVVFSGLTAVFFAFATVAAEHRGASPPEGLWLTYALGAIAVRLFGGRLPDRIGTRNLVAPALAAYAGAALLVAQARGDAAFLGAGLLGGVGHGYCFPVLTSQVVTRSADRIRGSALSMFTAIWEMSALTLTPLFGRFADETDDAAMFALGAVCAVVGLSVWAAMESAMGGVGEAPTPASAGPRGEREGPEKSNHSNE